MNFPASAVPARRLGSSAEMQVASRTPRAASLRVAPLTHLHSFVPAIPETPGTPWRKPDRVVRSAVHRPRRPCFRFAQPVCAQTPPLARQPLASKVNPRLVAAPCVPPPHPRSLCSGSLNGAAYCQKAKLGIYYTLALPNVRGARSLETSWQGMSLSTCLQGLGPVGGRAAATSGDLSSSRFSCS